jgi:hypothetical protein
MLRHPRYNILKRTFLCLTLTPCLFSPAFRYCCLFDAQCSITKYSSEHLPPWVFSSNSIAQNTLLLWNSNVHHCKSRSNDWIISESRLATCACVTDKGSDIFLFTFMDSITYWELFPYERYSPKHWLAPLSACLMLASGLLTLQFWWWKQYVSPKLQLTFSGLHRVMPQVIELFIATALSKWNML